MNTETLATQPPLPVALRSLRLSFPDSVPLSSEDLNWPGLTVFKAYAGHNEWEWRVPPLADNHLALKLSSCNRIQRRLAGDPPTLSCSEAGMIHLTPARREAQWRWSGHSETVHVLLRDELVTRVARDAFDRDPAKTGLEPLFCARDSLLQRVCRLLLSELEKPGPGDRLYVESLANVLAVHLLRHYSIGPVAEPRLKHGLPRPKLRRVIDYIDAHLDDGLSLEQMARLTGYSAFHFARLFKAATGRSPHQYLIESRVARAQELLKRSQIPTAEIAYAVGFSSQSHFVTAFKKVVGITPKVYRGN